MKAIVVRDGFDMNSFSRWQSIFEDSNQRQELLDGIKTEFLAYLSSSSLSLDFKDIDLSDTEAGNMAVSVSLSERNMGDTLANAELLFLEGEIKLYLVY